ncbi:hypothetical protein BJV78DRAFT_1127656 [Lactifluus subvellereus]|nr:hypothetical protein BJV78DRAFT_1127656 [Lactifluus subvellereus]
MAATISYSPRRPAPSSSTPNRNSDFFRPRLPSDPFTNVSFRQRGPIVLNSDRIYRVASTSQPRRDVILVLGVPSPDDLAPLFNSERLAFSLLIIASHRPPQIPPKVQPVIRILRLTEPLALEQAGAVRFVDILEWAERVARIWRKVGGIGVRELAEHDQEGIGALTPPPNLFSQSPKSDPPPSSISSRGDSTASSVLTMFSSKLSFLKKRGHRSECALPASDPSQRPFDALVNYLPSSISDKALLKQAILVTTISRPFLVAAAASSCARPPGSHRNFLSRLGRVYTTPPTPPLGSADSFNNLVTGSPFSQGPQTKSHLVHLLPSRPRDSVADRVLQSIESFLLSFSFPPTLQAKRADQLEPARTCLLDSAAFTEPVGVPPNLCVNWTVADVVLSGCLDDEPAPRVWLSGAADIVVAALPPSQPSLTTPPVARPEESYAASSPNLSTPLAYLGVNTPPTPPDSEEDTGYRHALATDNASGKRPQRWAFWKRSTSAPSFIESG